MSLEDRIKRFAAERRAILLQRLQEERNNDTEVVKWDGYDADGNPQVKTDDQTITADGTGLTVNNPNSELIHDKAGTVDYRKSPTDRNPTIRPFSVDNPRYKVTPYEKTPGTEEKRKGSDLILGQDTADSRNYYTAIQEDGGGDPADGVVDDGPKVHYAELRYSWSSALGAGGGTDLDTTTSLTIPQPEGPVGWAHSVSSSRNWLVWLGDAIGTSGTETVQVYLYRIWNDLFEGRASISRIKCRGNWYAVAGTYVTIQLRTEDNNGDLLDSISKLVYMDYYSNAGQGETGVLMLTIDIDSDGTISTY